MWAASRAASPFRHLASRGTAVPTPHAPALPLEEDTMGEFTAEISRRAESAAASLAAARADGDDYLVAVRLGELGELRRIASEHDVELTLPESTVAC